MLQNCRCFFLDYESSEGFSDNFIFPTKKNRYIEIEDLRY